MGTRALRSVSDSDCAPTTSLSLRTSVRTHSTKMYLRLQQTLGLFLCVNVCLTLACYGKQLLRSGGLTCQDKQLIVDMHNRLRQSIANGQVNGQPSASNMLEMVWDEELAHKAQSWADKCVGNHDSIGARSVSRFPVGQNLATTWSSPRPTSLGPNPDFATQINAWFNEVSIYRGGFSHSTGHYSQMVWGDTYLIGCGYSYYYDGSRYSKFYVCNYGPGGNIIGTAPYRVGPPTCSNYGSSPSRKYYGLCQVRGYYGTPCYYG